MDKIKKKHVKGIYKIGKIIMCTLYKPKIKQK